MISHNHCAVTLEIIKLLIQVHEVNQQIYDIQEIIANFNALLKGVDFTCEFEILQVSNFQFKLKKTLTLELESLYIALWRFAMSHSLPVEGQLIFDSFIEEHTKQNTLEEANVFKDRINEYSDLLAIHGNNYMAVSSRIISFTQIEESFIKPTTLRIALEIRQRYTQIFDRLI